MILMMMRMNRSVEDVLIRMSIMMMMMMMSEEDENMILIPRDVCIRR